MSSEKSRLFNRRVKKSARTLSLLLGVLAVFLGLAIYGLSFMQSPGNRARIQRISFVLAPAGLGLLAIYGAFFLLPDSMKRRKSPSWQRRDAIYGTGILKTKAKPGAHVEGRRAILPERGGREEGAVLVIVLAVLAAVAALVLQIQLSARSRQQITYAAARKSDLLRAATDSVGSAMRRLADDEHLTFDTREDSWAKREEIKTPQGIDTITTVLDENRFFDLNNLARRVDSTTRPAEDVLRNILNLCGRFDDGNMTRALLDWLDADDSGMFEKKNYEGRKPAYSTPNRMLFAWDELFAVDGWKPELFSRRAASTFRAGFNGDLVAAVSVLPVKEERVVPVNVNTASRETLLGVMGIEQDVVVNAILSMRKVVPVSSIDAVQQLMEPTLFAQVSPYLSVRSDYFRIESRAFSDGSSAIVRALARRSPDGRVDVVQWMLN